MLPNGSWTVLVGGGQINSMAVVLTLNPFSFYPPVHGGSLRAYHLLRELAREHEVHAVVLEPKAHFSRQAGGYAFPAAIQVHSAVDEPPPRDAFGCLPRRLAVALRGRWLRRTIFGSVGSFFLNTHHLIRQILAERTVDVAFLPLDNVTVGGFIRQLSPRTVRVLDSYNVEHKILEQQLNLETNPGRQAQLRRSLLVTRRIEEKVHIYADALIACSDVDRDQLMHLNDALVPGYTVPNGVDTVARPFEQWGERSKRPNVLFLGSLTYPPNKDGLEWFHQCIWPLVREQIPQAVLTVLGTGDPSTLPAHLLSDRSVRFVGQVDDVRPYHREAGVLAVPLRMGSGTRLKILEAMSSGTPVVSTKIGAAGLEVVDGEHLLLRDDPVAQADGICELLVDPTRAERLRLAARRLAEECYDWWVIGNGLNRLVRQLTLRDKR